MSGEFRKLACKNISFEVSSYFPDMSVCQVLKRYGALPTVECDNSTPPLLSSAPSQSLVRTHYARSPRRSVADRLQDDLESFSTSAGTRSSPRAAPLDAFEVSCEACTTTVRSCREGEVLKGYMVVWASSVLTVSVSPKSTPNGRRSQHTDSYAASTTSLDKTTLTLACHSLHIINKDVAERRRPGSYALQSIFQPRHPFLLECYPRHMMHLALVTYALWHAPAGLLSAFTSSLASPKTTAPPSVDAGAIASAATTSCLPASAGDAVLVLGLGGNVIGRCLDALLPPVVRLDTVEIEPAILQTCVEQHQVPPLRSHTMARTADATLAKVNRKRLRDSDSSSLMEKGSAAGEDGAYVYWSAQAPDTTTTDGDEVKAEGDDPTATARDRSDTGKIPKNKSASQKAPAFTLASSSSDTRAPTSERGQRYRFFLDDAYHFLRRPELAVDAASLTSTCANYNMIFLDCYDPDREKMMFEEGLISLCHKRLRPGGCLLVNAHILPKRVNLEGAFLFNGFATVQVLRVAGCDQCIVACVRSDDDVEGETGHTEKKEKGLLDTNALEMKQQRFTRGNVAHAARLLNTVFLHGWRAQQTAVTPHRSPRSRRRSGDTDGAAAQTAPFILEEMWLHKNTRAAHMELEAQEASGTKGTRIRQSDCRVWEHTT